MCVDGCQLISGTGATRLDGAKVGIVGVLSALMDGMVISYFGRVIEVVGIIVESQFMLPKKSTLVR